MSSFVCNKDVKKSLVLSVFYTATASQQSKIHWNATQKIRFCCDHHVFERLLYFENTFKMPLNLITRNAEQKFSSSSSQCYRFLSIWNLQVIIFKKTKKQIQKCAIYSGNKYKNEHLLIQNHHFLFIYYNTNDQYNIQHAHKHKARFL